MDVFSLLNESYSMLPAEQQQQERKALAHHLNGLLLHDFPALVQLLYRVDVPEKKVAETLKLYPDRNAGELLADLLIQRVTEKVAARKAFRSAEGESEEERW
jgi:hypothetical protein